jgi:hypothetical protein
LFHSCATPVLRPMSAFERIADMAQKGGNVGF